MNHECYIWSYGQQVTHAPSLHPSSRLRRDPCPQRGLLVLPLVAVLEQMVPGLVGTTAIAWVAPPTVVVLQAP